MEEACQYCNAVRWSKEMFSEDINILDQPKYSIALPNVFTNIMENQLTSEVLYLRFKNIKNKKSLLKILIFSKHK